MSCPDDIKPDLHRQIQNQTTQLAASFNRLVELVEVFLLTEHYDTSDPGAAGVMRQLGACETQLTGLQQIQAGSK